MNATRNFLILTGVIVALGTTSNVRADFTFGEPVRVGSGLGMDWVACFSCDGLEMYFGSPRSGGQGNVDLWVLKRASVDDDWGPPQNLGPAVNSSKNEFFASISTDGLTLYFDSDQPYGDAINLNIYMATRATKNDPWGPAVKMGPEINGAGNVSEVPWISPDGLELYFDSWRSGSLDLYVARRATVNDPWGNAVNLGPVVNSPYDEEWPSLSPDGLLLLFSGMWVTSSTPRPGGYGSSDLWMARRASLSDPWQPPINLGPKVNSPATNAAPRISPDGRTLYFTFSTTQAWQAPILPIVDFNGDSKVDDEDLVVMMQHWGESYPRCDIGPFAWGDGVVDEQDLRVLTEALMTPCPGASDVACDVVLNWALPSSAQTCDVYFGTSFEAVNTANRANPQGVLVSQGQTATTYDPAGVLELSRTYYWRVDFLTDGPAPIFYRGPVLKFTTAALTYPIKNVAAKASSAQAGNGPEKTVDGSGLDKSDGHSTDPKDMWWSLPGSSHWIQYGFDGVYTLHELWVWNSNQVIEPLVGFGAKTVKIDYSTDGTTWTALANVPEFARGPGKPGYAANTIVSFAGVPAKYVKLTIEKNWGVAPQTGLSEVRFFCIQNAAVPKP